METFSALLAFCAGNSPVTGEFPSQRPVTRSFNVFFDLRPNKCFSKQSWCWRFETPSCPLWRHCNVLVRPNYSVSAGEGLTTIKRWQKTASWIKWYPFHICISYTYLQQNPKMYSYFHLSSSFKVGLRSVSVSHRRNLCPLWCNHYITALHLYIQTYFLWYDYILPHNAGMLIPRSRS